MGFAGLYPSYGENERHRTPSNEAGDPDLVQETPFGHTQRSSHAYPVAPATPGPCRVESKKPAHLVNFLQ
ncbi:hypothetical protein thsps21_10620 [Pseudomonas sp. No.21]|nr:hypothetical protein TUM20249_00300 [Pseudomonas tohonis]